MIYEGVRISLKLHGIGVKGVSEVIGAVLLLAVSISAIALVLLYSTGTMDDIRERSLLEGAKEGMRDIDRAVKEVSTEGEGSSREIEMSGGEYLVDPSKETIRFELDSKSGTIPPAISRKEGPYFISTGADVKAYEGDVTGDGVAELVLENSHLVVAIKKITDSKINTSSLIALMRIRETGQEIFPEDSSIVVDGIASSASGRGSTRIEQAGDRLTKGSIVTLVDSKEVSYELWYTLRSGADFVEADVKNVVHK